MANAGEGMDTKLLKKFIRKRYYIPLLESDNDIDIQIKNIMNNLIENDEVQTKTYNSTKYEWHSAWQKLSRVLIKINQLRVNNFYYKPLKVIRE